MRSFVSGLILAAAACSGPAPGPVATPRPQAATAPAPTPVIALDPAKGVVLPADKAQRLAHQCSRKSPGPVTGVWLPSPDMIADLEASLGMELERRIAATPSAGVTPQDYYRQYGGILIGERQVIYVNGVAARTVERELPGGETWKTEPAMICDGGTITFGVEYDPATKTFSNFAFNGRA